MTSGVFSAPVTASAICWRRANSALFADIAGLGIAVVAQDFVHPGLVEGAVQAGERLLGLDEPGDLGVGDRARPSFFAVWSSAAPVSKADRT